MGPLLKIRIIQKQMLVIPVKKEKYALIFLSIDLIQFSLLWRLKTILLYFFLHFARQFDRVIDIYIST